jgi:hypothetical protein
LICVIYSCANSQYLSEMWFPLLFSKERKTYSPPAVKTQQLFWMSECILVAENGYPA